MYSFLNLTSWSWTTSKFKFVKKEVNRSWNETPKSSFGDEVGVREGAAVCGARVVGLKVGATVTGEDEGI